MKEVNVMKRLAVTLLLFLTMMPLTLQAQDKVEASVSGDLVSHYIWRGQDLGGVSIQPTLNIAYKGFYAEAWGSIGFDSEDSKEFDLTIGYETGGFSISLTDFWSTGETGYFHYGARSTSHVFCAQVGYDFGPLAVSWDTNFAGADGMNEKGERAYSSYFSLTAPFILGGLEWEAEMGLTPWATDYYCTTGFAVCDLSLTASKEIKITDHFSLPLFAKATWNPATEDAFFVLGVSL